MSKPFQLIAFDLDGTLVNSLPDLTLSINSALAEAGLPTAPESLVMTWVGKGIDVLFAQAIAWTSPNTHLPPETISHIKSRFNDFYGENICNKSTLYPQVYETLEVLCEQGYVLALVTNKPTQHVPAVLSAFNLTHFFTETLGGHSLPKIKPHPAPLFYLCGKLGYLPAEMLFVGDSSNDIIAAKSAGCQSVGLTYGYNYNIPIADSSPDYIFDDFAQLLTIL